MPNFSYSIFEQSKNQTIFAFGENWLIGLTAQKNEILLSKIKSVVEKEKPEISQIENAIDSFITWYRESYRVAKQQECPYDDNEIVENVGVMIFDKLGKTTSYTFGRFQFWLIKNDKVYPFIANSFQLSNNHIIVADPKNTEVAKSILVLQKSQVRTDNPEKYKGIFNPFALISVSNAGAINWRKYLLAALLTIFFGVIGILSWQNREQITEFFTHKTDTFDSTFVNPDSAFQDSLPETPPISEDNTLPSNPIDSVKNEEPRLIPVDKKSADDYYDVAEQSLSFGRAFLEDGKNSKAQAQLDTAAYYYHKYLQLKPEMIDNIQPKLNEIKLKKSLIGDKENL